MAKYIRTTKGIYEKNKCKSAMWKIGIVQEADTIEELCDEFVMINDYCFTKPQIIDWLDLDMYKGEDIYGAIWTDKGLIYVAKMNEKGEFELRWQTN